MDRHTDRDQRQERERHLKVHSRVINTHPLEGLREFLNHENYEEERKAQGRGAGEN